MDARELRIGNWVNDCINEENVIINGFHSTTIWLLNNNNNQYQVACSIPKPIPLTEEILDKIGEIKLRDSSVYGGETSDYVGKLVFDDENNVYDDTVAYCNKINLKPIKYIHELQNLVFGITGEELNIEL